MELIYLTLVMLLMLTLAVGMARIARGPTAADRMLAAMLLGTTGVAIVVLLAAALGQPGLVDIALVLALLASVAMVAFVRDTWATRPTDGGNRAHP